jgi:hypothetical protein
VALQGIKFQTPAIRESGEKLHALPSPRKRSGLEQRIFDEFWSISPFLATAGARLREL